MSQPSVASTESAESRCTIMTRCDARRAQSKDGRAEPALAGGHTAWEYGHQNGVQAVGAVHEQRIRPESTRSVPMPRTAVKTLSTRPPSVAEVGGCACIWHSR